MFSEPPPAPLPSQAGGVTNTNGHLLRTHQYARISTIAYTELLENCPFARAFNDTAYQTETRHSLVQVTTTNGVARVNSKQCMLSYMYFLSIPPMNLIM